MKRKHSLSPSEIDQSREDITTDKPVTTEQPSPVTVRQSKRTKTVPKIRKRISSADMQSTSAIDSNEQTPLSSQDMNIVVLFTGIGPESVQKFNATVKHCGGTVTDDPLECTHLVTNDVHRMKLYLLN